VLAAARVGERGHGRPLEVWFQDEARVGQKGATTRQWARRGTRPRQTRDHRFEAAYLFAAVCPERDEAVALILPAVNAAAMGLHLAEISARVAADAHAVVVLDQAGWHMAGDLAVPPNLSLLPLPAYSPELNPVENVWQFLRHTFLNTRVFADYGAILEACCRAWTALLAIPGRLRSITARDWAKPVSSSDG
jgi:hypothetical protein